MGSAGEPPCEREICLTNPPQEPASGRGGSSPEKRALIEAYETAVKSTADRHAADQAPLPRRRTGRIVLWTLALASLAGGGYVLAVRPAWLFTPPPPPESRDFRNASLRVAIYLTAQRLELYRRAHGKFPPALSELRAAVPPGIGYAATDSEFVLQGAVDADSVTFHSTDSLRPFLGNSYQVLSQRGAR